jgi:hypothetical protein
MRLFQMISTDNQDSRYKVSEQSLSASSEARLKLIAGSGNECANYSRVTEKETKSVENRVSEAENI